jgi:hypothetical protein
LALRDFKEKLALRDFKEKLVHRDFRVFKELKVCKVCPAHKVTKE